MTYTVKQLADLSGVTPRTLRHYDNIGLLCPSRAENGYRFYSGAHVDLLQQILFFKECGLELAQISGIIADAGFDIRQAMEAHIRQLQGRRAALDGLLATAEKTLANMKGEEKMNDSEKFAGFKRKMIDANEAEYGAEVRAKWGDEAIDASNARMMNMTQEHYSAFEALGRELNDTLARATETKDPAGVLAQRAAALHKDWLCCTWPQYTAAAHRGLADMYVQDERFTAYYEKIAPGAAAFLRDAIAIFTSGQN